MKILYFSNFNPHGPHAFVANLNYDKKILVVCTILMPASIRIINDIRIITQMFHYCKSRYFVKKIDCWTLIKKLKLTRITLGSKYRRNVPFFRKILLCLKTKKKWILMYRTKCLFWAHKKNQKFTIVFFSTSCYILT